MRHLEVKETDTVLVTLLNEVTASKSEVVMTRNGQAIARLIPCKIKSSSTPNYPLRGMPIVISEDFDEPMPELWEALGE